MTSTPGSGNMHNLTTLVKRLEAATSRLEDIASSVIQQPVPNGTVTSASPESAPNLSDQKEEEPEIIQEALPESVENFDNFISGPVQKFGKISEELGGPILEQSRSLLNAFYGQRKFIYITTKAKKPDMSSATFMELLRPLQESITAVSEIRDSNRGSPVFNLLSAVSESIGFLAWITVEPKPSKHIDEFFGSAQYWGNRVLKEFKDIGPKQVEWTQLYYQVLKSLSEYVKDTFPSGILWNPEGVSAEEAVKAVEIMSSLSSATKSNVAASSTIPPPPPPPPGPVLPPIKSDDVSKEKLSGNAGGLDAVFSELNKGSDVTKGLKKVNADQMTHKNPSLRASNPVIARSNSNTSESSLRSKNPAPGKKPKPEKMRTKKPAIKKLEGNKWFIENFEDEPEPITIEASITQSILISRCKNTTIIIQQKANAISIDNSPRLSLIIDSLVSSIDVIKSSGFAIQVLGSLPTLLLDAVDGAQIYLGRASLGTEIFSSKTTGVNLNIIDASKEDGDYEEVPLPAQIRSWIEDGKVKNEIVEHVG